MGKVISDQDRNAFTYCLVSVITMTMLGFTITMAQAGYDYTGETYQKVTSATTGSNSLYKTLNASEGANYNDISKNYSTNYPPTNVFDPLSNAVNWPSAIGKLFSIVGLTAGNALTLSFWAGSIGGMLGWVLLMTILIWQISVGYYIVAFILPRLRR